MIKKKISSTYYSEESIIYTCSNCGDEFYFKFKDSRKCFSCQKEIHHEINEKLRKFKENQKQENIKYSKYYVGKSKRKGKKV